MSLKLGLGAQREPRELRPRIFAVGGFFLLGLFVLSINLYRLMVVRYEEFTALSVDNEFKDFRVRAPRGLIRDRRGEVLVDARPSLDVFITPAFCQKCVAEVIPRLQSMLGWDPETTAHVIDMVKSARGPSRYQQIVVQVDLSRDDFDLLNAHQYQLPGVDLEPVPHRHYRAGTALAHVLGYMNEVTSDELVKLNGGSDVARPPYAMGDYTGRRGVERSFESYLRGQDGWVKQVVNARGELMRDATGSPMKRDEVPPRPGRNLVLSIDARLQLEAERAFPPGTSAGAIVVLDAKTGFVRAMVSRPSFDPNEMTGRVSPQRLAQLNADPLKPMIFRPTAERYSPGSTFKVVPLLAALRAGSFTQTSAVSCGGGYQLGSRRWRCHKESGHGVVHAREALQWSCDTYFYKVSDSLGIDPIAEVGKELGLGAVTNFGKANDQVTAVAAEVPGVMPSSEYHNRVTPGGYTKGMALNTAIGQGDVNVTPLQLAVLYAALGNGGHVFQPQVVERIETPEGKVLEQFGAKLVRDVEITPEQRTVIVDALKAVVNEAGGTAFRSRLANVVVAGKTGTAQVARLGATRLKKEQMSYWERDHAWFASFAPADEPEIAVIVLNEHGGHGGSDAAPAAMAVIKKYFELKKLDGEAFGDGYTAEPNRPVPPPTELLMPPLVPPRDNPGTGVAVQQPALKPELAGSPSPLPDVAPPAPPPPAKTDVPVVPLSPGEPLPPADEGAD
ncbi:MAG: penicillin-binding protein 2 [Archangium sp.]|nr:penicillin-binding protein 2 [Archangium sp.]